MYLSVGRETPGGWITFPGGTYQVDPSSNIQRNPGEGISYDRAVNRWVAADWNHLSPDGKRFVWGHPATALEVVDINTGADKAIQLPPVYGNWVVVDFTASGVYLTLIGGLDAPEPGLWVVNPDSGQVRKLDGTQYWSAIDTTAAWGVKGVGSSRVLSRLDLRTGRLSTQLTIPYHTPLQPGDMSLELIALDAQGRPLVLLRDWQNPYPWHLAILDGPENLRPVAIPDAWTAGWPILPYSDAFQSARTVKGYLLTHGIWMIGNLSFGGIALLGSDGVIRQLATEPPNVYAIAGGCH